MPAPVSITKCSILISVTHVKICKKVEKVEEVE